MLVVHLSSFFNLGARWGWMSAPRHDRFTPGNDPIDRVSQEEWTKLLESVPYVKIYRYNPEVPGSIPGTTRFSE